MSNEQRNSFGQRLELARAHLGLGQDQMADQMGVSLRSYSRYASGDRDPQVSDVAPLSALGIDLNWLLTGRGAMVPSTVPKGANPPDSPEPSAIDDELMARVVDTVAGAYKEAGVILVPMDLGRLAGMHYRRVSRTNVSGSPLNWDETLAMLRFLRISILDELRKGSGANANGKSQGGEF